MASNIPNTQLETSQLFKNKKFHQWVIRASPLGKLNWKCKQNLAPQTEFSSILGAICMFKLEKPLLGCTFMLHLQPYTSPYTSPPVYMPHIVFVKLGIPPPQSMNIPPTTIWWLSAKYLPTRDRSPWQGAFFFFLYPVITSGKRCKGTQRRLFHTPKVLY